MGETLRLGDFCSKIGSGATPRGGKDSYLEIGPFALIRSQNVYNHGFERTGLAYISENQANALSNVEVQTGDVLLNITGDSVARACQVTDDVLPARVNQHVAIIRPDGQNVDARFLRYYLVSPTMQAEMLALASAGATRPALTKGMIENFRIPAFSIQKQRAIAGVLSALDDKIELNRRTGATLEAMARAIFRDWFVDFGPTRAKMQGREPYLAPDLWPLFPASLDDQGIPEGWEMGTLGDVADTNAASWTARSHPDEVEYVDLSKTKWGTIESTAKLPWEKAPSRARRIARAGDTIIGTTRPGNGSFAYISRDGLTVSTGFAVLTPKRPEFRDFVYIAATDPENIRRLANLADGHGGAYPAVRPAEVSDTPVVIPPDEVIDAFAKAVSPLRARIEFNKTENETLAQTRDLLLPRLMSGEIRVAEAEKIVEGEV
ncbi:restriction endonuclease subunit S [Jhaorihella thermophila]|uniref:Type I restriction enzyme, S subunit n=1 Tax=Jhaorihella thermophila TaxID=488547 RepID=A0A1H5YGS8_9RHOB|nr:restriction endonuclease subunit S [Jhaorihella thermophila]SEG23238.1 type I restriction enzyme, S subunit [Jhaorihella thermophila]